jgi:hypothetical protein
MQELHAVLLKAREATVKLQEERDKYANEAAKLRYQVLHLKRAVAEADANLAGKA